jgi:pimeloyl-ACP methyl ester carboxylesterase
VYLDAPVPRDGQRACDLVPSPPPRPRSSEGAEEAASAEMPVEIPPTPVKAGEEYSEEDARFLNARLSPMPTRPSFEPITLKSAAALALPRTYVFCARSPPWIPATYARKRFDEEGISYRLLDAGHDAPITAPDAIAALLLEIATSSPH